MKKKAQDKGEDEKMPSILKKEKGIIQKLKEEQVDHAIYFFKFIALFFNLSISIGEHQ